MTQTRSIVVTGDVQGVGFRHFTYRLAVGMGITGLVWNREDGAVEVIAQHLDPKVLDDFCDALWDGPGGVEQVSATRVPTQREYAEFAIGQG